MAEENRFIRRYERGGRIVSGHNKTVHTSPKDANSKKSGPPQDAIGGLAGDATEELDRVQSHAADSDESSYSFDENNHVAGWSSLKWGVSVSDAVVQSSTSSSWNEIKGEGFVVNSDGDVIWLGPGVELVGVSLDGVVAPNANLSEATLEECSVTGANLSGANWSGATLSNVDISNSDLSGGSWNKAVLLRCRVEEETNLSSMSWHGVGIGSSSFTGVDMRFVDATEAQIVNSSFESAQAQNSLWGKALLSGTGLRISRFDNADWSGLVVENVKCAAVGLYGVNAHGASFDGFSAFSSDLRKMDFTSASGSLSVHPTCRYEAIPAGYVPVESLTAGVVEGRSNATNETLSRAHNWDDAASYHIPMWSYQMLSGG